MHQDEPAVGVVLGGAGLAGHIGLDAVAAADGHAGADVDDAAHRVQQRQRRRAGQGRLRDRGVEVFQHHALAVLDPGHDHRLDVAAAIGDRAVRRDHFLERHRAAAQRQRHHLVQLALPHAHRARQPRDALRPDPLHHLRGDGVLGIRQTLAQRHGLAAGCSAIARPPHHALVDGNLDRLVNEGVAGPGAGFERRTVDEGFEGRARLASGLRDVVELVLREIAAADPGTHFAIARIQRQEAGLQAGLVLLERLHETGVGLQLLDDHIVGLARVVRHLVLARLPQKGEHHVARPRGTPPVGQRLEHLDLACQRLVRHVLDPRIDRGANHQTVGVDAVALAVGPFNQPAAQLLAQVRRRTQCFVLPFKVDFQRTLFQRLVVRRLELVVLDHLGQHKVAALGGALRIDHRVVVAGAFEHADQGCAFEHVELVGGFVEVGPRRHVDAVSVVEKRHGVQVGFEDFLLAVDGLDLDCGDRLLELARQCLGAADLFRIEVAGELLRERRAALAATGERVPCGTRGPPEVHPVVLVEAAIFSRDQRGDHVRGNVRKLDPIAVGALEHREFLAIGRHHEARLLGPGLADVADAGSQGNQREDVQHDQHREHGKQQARAQPPASRKPVVKTGNEIPGTGEACIHCRK